MKNIREINIRFCGDCSHFEHKKISGSILKDGIDSLVIDKGGGICRQKGRSTRNSSVSCDRFLEKLYHD